MTLEANMSTPCPINNSYVDQLHDQYFETRDDVSMIEAMENVWNVLVGWQATAYGLDREGWEAKLDEIDPETQPRWPANSKATEEMCRRIHEIANDWEDL